MYCSTLIVVLYLMAMLEVSGFLSIADLDIHVLLCYYVYHGIMDRSYYYGLMYFLMKVLFGTDLWYIWKLSSWGLLFKTPFTWSRFSCTLIHLGVMWLSISAAGHHAYCSLWFIFGFASKHTPLEQVYACCSIRGFRVSHQPCVIFVNWISRLMIHVWACWRIHRGTVSVLWDWGEGYHPHPMYFNVSCYWDVRISSFYCLYA